MMKNNQELKYSKSNPETIQAMFSTIAHRYDRANRVLSFNFHKLWNRQLVKHVLKNSPENGLNFLDLCSGTGDIAFEIIKKKETSKVYLLDFCSEMLKYAEKKAHMNKLNPAQTIFIQADAQQLPFDDQQMDCITIAYGIRNVQNPEKCFEESYRILKKGGVFGILELTEPTNPLLRQFHHIYLKKIMPLLGKMVATNKQAYDYLSNSIQSFVTPEHLIQSLYQVNFKEVFKKKMFGGIATIIIAKK